MPSTLIVVAGPPLPGRWALARALATRLGARYFDTPDVSQLAGALDGESCVVVHGELCRIEARAAVLSVPADERVLVALGATDAEAHREIFNRWASRPLSLAEGELDRYRDWATRAEPVGDDEADAVVRVSVQAPLQDQVLRVVEAMKPRPVPVETPTHQTSVLLVEDDPDQRALLGDVLRELGCRVDAAPDAYVALALLDADERAYDLVLSDERMPGMSGIELTEELARRHPGVRAVLLTAHADDDTVARALRARAGNVLSKPFAVMDLQRVLNEL